MTAPALACEKCPTCSNPLIPGTEGSVKVLACLTCGTTSPVGSDRAVQFKLPGMQPGRQEVLVQETEEPIMQRIIGALRMAGYEVLCTVHRRKWHKCSACGHGEFPGGGLGTTPGVPDVLVRHPAWPIKALWLGVETKGTKTPLSPAQKALFEAGAIIVVRSEADALLALEEIETALRGGEAGE